MIKKYLQQIFIFKGVYYSFKYAYYMNYKRNKGWLHRGPYITYKEGESLHKNNENCDSSHMCLYNANTVLFLL